MNSVVMKQLPDILTSATFWASIATMWAASGAWFTYVAAAVDSRQQTYEGMLSLIEGLEAEFALVSQWAGNEGGQGYVSKTRAQLRQEHLDWFNPTRSVFKFGTPVLIMCTNSPYAKSLRLIIRPHVMLNHSIRRCLSTSSDTSHSCLGTSKYEAYSQSLELTRRTSALRPRLRASLCPIPLR